MQRDIFRKVALDRLSTPEQLDQLMRITSPAGWLALIALGGLLLVAVGWSIWGTVTLAVPARAAIVQPGADAAARTTAMHAVLFVPRNLQPQVRPGMEVRIYPAHSDGAADEYARGTIAAVDAVVVDPTASDQIAGIADVARDPSAVALRVTLAPDPTAAPIAVGTLVDAAIVLGEQHPIAYVLPNKDER